MMKNSNRVLWLDIVRATAIISVIVCHVTEAVYPLNMEFMSQTNWHTKLMAFTLFTFGRLGVPFFLFATGYLLLDRSYGRAGTWRFWKKNLLRLFITVEVWIVVYHFFLHWLKGSEIRITVLFKNMLFLKNVEMSHMWYIPMILGMYIFLPFVADSLQHIDFEILKLPISIVCVYLFVLPVMNVVCLAFGRNAGTNLLSLDYGGGIYGLYFIMGYLLKKGILKRFHIWQLAFGGISGFFGVVGIQLFSYGRGNAYNVWYNNIFLLFGSMMFFEMISRLRIQKNCWIWDSLSKYSFGIYLLHNMVLLILRVYVAQTGKPEIKFILFLSVTLLTSWLTAAGISRIPGIGKQLLYIK